MSVTITVGTLAQATATFTDETGRAANPTTVRFRVHSPGFPTPPEAVYVFGTDSNVTNPAVGTFVCTWTLDDEGDWKVRAEGTGAVVAAVEGTVFVPESSFA